MFEVFLFLNIQASVKIVKKISDQTLQSLVKKKSIISLFFFIVSFLFVFLAGFSSKADSYSFEVANKSKIQSWSKKSLQNEQILYWPEDFFIPYTFNQGLSESVSYDVFWKFLKVGESIFGVSSPYQEEFRGGGDLGKDINEEYYEMTFHAYSTPFWSRFYKVSYQAWTEVGVSFFQPYYVQIKNFSKDHRFLDLETVFFHHNMTAVYSGLSGYDSSRKKENKSWFFLEGSQSRLSAIHYMRFFPLKVGRAYSFPVADRGENKQFYFEVRKKERIRTKLDFFDTFVLAVRDTLTLGSSHAKNIKIWVTDDEQRSIAKMALKINGYGLEVKANNIEWGR